MAEGSWSMRWSEVPDIVVRAHFATQTGKYMKVELITTGLES